MLSRFIPVAERTVASDGMAPLRKVGWALALGVGTSIWTGSGAIAAESVVLTFQDQQRTVPVSNLATFVTTGEAVSEDVRAFFSEHPVAARVAQTILDAEVYISPSFVERFGGSSLGEFVLIQLNRIVGTPSGREDLEPLRVAMVDSFRNDNRFTILELVENYPEETVRLDFSRLEPVYNDVQAFVEKVQPALDVAREFLADIVCDCETAEATESPATESPAEDTPAEDTPAAEPAPPVSPDASPEDAMPENMSPEGSSTLDEISPDEMETDSVEEEGMVVAPTDALEADPSGGSSAAAAATAPSPQKTSTCETP